MDLNNLLLDYFQSKTHERKSHYSSAITSCSRKLYYQWTGASITNPPTVPNYIKMDMGNYIEDLLERSLKHACLTSKIDGYEAQRKLHIDIGLRYPLSVKFDFIIYLHNGLQILVECKSSLGRRTRNIKKTGILPEDYMIQCGLYMKHFKKNRLKLFYLSRDDGYTAQFNLVMKDSKILFYDNYNRMDEHVYVLEYEKHIDKLTKLEINIDYNVLPKREYNLIIVNGVPKYQIQRHKEIFRSDWQCLDYCEYRNLCWRIGEQNGM